MLIYTQMDARGTAFMQVLGLPFYFTALLAGLVVSPWFPGAYLLTLFVTYVIYSFAYSKALYYFLHRLHPARPLWQFILVVLAAQALILVATLYAFAA